MAIVAAIELVFYRVVTRLVRLDPLGPGGRWLRILEDIGLFTFELVSVLSTLVFAIALVTLVLLGKGHRASARVSFAVVGLPLVFLTMMGAAFNLPASLQFHVQLSFFFLVLLFLLSVFSSNTEGRFKLGAFLFWLPVSMRAMSIMIERFNPAFAETISPTRLASGAEIAWGAAAMLSPLLFVARARLKISAITVGVAILVAIFGLIIFDRDAAALIFGYGFGFDLQHLPLATILLPLAFGGLTVTLTANLAAGGWNRLRALGIALIAMCGVQVELPYEIALISLGFIALADASVRGGPQTMTRAAFEALVRNIAAALGAPQVTLTGSSGEETARLHPQTVPPSTVSLQRRQGALAELEIVVGEAPPRDPPFTLQRRGGPKLGPRGEGEIINTGDAAFDRIFIIRDKRDVGAHILDDATRPKLIAEINGWLGIWPQRGLRYHATKIPENLPDLLQHLITLTTRTAS